MSVEGFLPEKGNYKALLSYQKSVIIFDCTYIFCQRFFKKYDRTIDQMVQAARSGKQNILEGSKAAVTSSETEIKLTSVARSSLEELLEDYNDFQRVRKITCWDKNCKEAGYVRNVASGKIPFPKIDGLPRPNSPNNEQECLRQVFVHFIETRPADVCANIMICLINQCNFLLDRQIKKLEKDFLKGGGLRECMYTARKNHRRGQ